MSANVDQGTLLVNEEVQRSTGGGDASPRGAINVYDDGEDGSSGRTGIKDGDTRRSGSSSAKRNRETSKLKQEGRHHAYSAISNVEYPRLGATAAEGIPLGLDRAEGGRGSGGLSPAGVDNPNSGVICLRSRRHVAIPISYFCIGFLGSFMINPLNIYMIQSLNAQPSQQNTLVILMTIPWSFKLVYGFFSDVFPIGGLRRKPYLVAGYSVSSFCYLLLALTPQVGIQSLSGLLFLATMGQIMGDVMADTLVVERARGEAEESSGQMQATCYAIRFVGNVIGCLGGALLYNTASWGWGLTFQQVCLICGLMPALSLAPATFFLWEGRSKETKNVKKQVHDIWNTIQLHAVWRPMAFVYIFNLFQVPNIAWQSYLQLSLHFEPYMLGFMAAAGSVMTCAGVLAYKNFFFTVSWRLIYGWSVVVTSVFSALQLVLIFGLNRQIGLPDFWFALGDDVITQYIQGIQFLPVCIMYLRMCPDGSEGATYAALTTFGNIALTCAGSLGTLVAKLWDVGNDALRAGDVDGLWKLTILTSVVAPLPLVLLRLLPANAAEQSALRLDTKRSARGGAIFLFVLVSSLTWTVVEAFYVLTSEPDKSG